MNDSAAILIFCAVFICTIAIAGIVLTCRRCLRRVVAPSSEPPITALSLQAEILTEFESRGVIPATGQEVFFPRSPHPDPVYEITFAGILRDQWGSLADAKYGADARGNFVESQSWLVVNDSWLYRRPHEWIDCDRCEHRYTVRIDGSPQRLSLAIHAKRGRLMGSLIAEVKLLRAGTPTVAARQRDKEMRQQAERKARIAGANFAGVIRSLSLRAELFRNLEDPEYRAKFVEVHHEKILKEQAEIRAEALQLLEQDEVVNYLRKHNPAVVERFLGRLAMVHLAERVSLEKRLTAAAPPPAPPRKKLTAEEVRAIKLHHQRVQDQDRVALKLDRIQTRLQIRERLGDMPLDPDERDMLEHELIEEIDAGEDDANTKTL